MSVDKARELFLSGYNCAQAIAGGFSDKVGLEESKALSLSSCFGAGIAATRGLCGALSGAMMILGLVKQYDKPDDKAKAYADGKKLLSDFKEEFSSTQCCELLTVCKARYADTPSERTPEYYRARPCVAIVEFVANWLTDNLNLN